MTIMPMSHARSTCAETPAQGVPDPGRRDGPCQRDQAIVACGLRLGVRSFHGSCSTVMGDGWHAGRRHASQDVWLTCLLPRHLVVETPQTNQEW